MNSAGAIAPDGDYNVEFKFYDTASSGATAQGVCTGNCKWLETRTSANKVHIANGYLTANLGSVTAFGSTINWDQELWITMNIGGTGSPSWDGEMTPRLKLTAVPYAFKAGQLAKLTGTDTSTLDFDTQTGPHSILLPDASGTLCIQGAASCGFATGSGTAFVQGGNTLGAAADLGTNDSFAVNLRTGGTTRVTIAANGSDVTLASNTDLLLQGATAYMSNPQTQTNSEAFGLNATVTGSDALAVGNGASSAASGTAVGRVAQAGSGASALGVDAQALGADALALGSGTRAGSTNSIALGADSQTTAANQLVIGDSSGTAFISQVVIGDGVTSATPNSFTLQGTSGNGSNIAGASVTLAGGQSTGSASGGNVVIQTSSAGGGGSGLNSLTTRATFDSSNNLYLGNGVTAAAPNSFSILGTGSSTSGTAGGSLTIQGGAGNGAISGGTVSVIGGTAGATGTGGNLTVRAGSGGATSGGGGALTLQGGNAAASNSAGGNVSVIGGTATGSGASGNVTIQGGAVAAAAGSNGGTVTLQGAAGSTTGAGGTGGGVTINGGNAGGSGANTGGSISLLSGTATSTGAASTISITSGAGASGNNVAGGNITITTGAGGGTQAGGTLGLAAGIGGATGNGGAITLNGGAAGGATRAGGAITLTGGTGNTSGLGGAVTIQGGTGGNAAVGGLVTIQGGNAGGGNTNGGNVSITGGTAAGTGARGLVVIDTPTFTTASTQSCGSNCNVTQANIDNSGAVVVNATASSLTVTLTDPTITTAGRIVYVTAANGSNDFTLSVNGGGTGNQIAMRQNTTATMVWNGADWTAAGASSSTTLQAAYDNTLSSAGGAEIVLNNTATSDGLTIRNSSSNPIIGAILEAQTSIGSNLFSVNNNATEYASNGGAETAGASSSTFPATTWSAAPAGGTVSRNTTAANNATGQASVSVVTTATIGHGARDRLAAALTANLQYTISYTVKGATSFTTLNTIYSRDGTDTSTTTCASGSTVTTAIWTRISCTFVAPASGITSSNEIFIRQSDATARTFYIDNLSVTVNASANHAADGSVDSALGTNWTAYDADGGAGTTSLARETTIIYDTSGSVSDVTSAHVNEGMRNNMTITPQVSTQYLVTFYARSSNTFNDITVGFLPAGGNGTPAAAQLCTDYNTQSVSTSGWTKVTCVVTTSASGITDPDLVIYQPSASARTFYVDALSITLNTNNASNVQVGGANKGGPPTLFTLDRSSSAPIASNNDAYLGSMYYDTSSGRIQCYEADGWGACGAAPDNIVNLNPEYTGAVLNGSGIGTMTADLCSNDSDLSVNSTLCSAGQAKNYYKWTSPQASQQTYSIYVSYQLPATFNGFSSDDTVQLVARTDSTSNAAVTYEMYKSTGADVSLCGTGETTVVTSANTWQSVGINGNEATGCSFSSSSAGNFVIFKINLKARSNANAYVSTLSFTTTGR